MELKVLLSGRDATRPAMGVLCRLRGLCQAPFDQGTAVAGGKSAHRITLGVRLSLRLSVNYSDYHWHLRRGAVDYGGTLAVSLAVSIIRRVDAPYTFSRSGNHFCGVTKMVAVVTNAESFSLLTRCFRLRWNCKNTYEILD